MSMNDILYWAGQVILFAAGVSFIVGMLGAVTGIFMAVKDAVKKNNVVKNGFY